MTYLKHDEAKNLVFSPNFNTKNVKEVDGFLSYTQQLIQLLSNQSIIILWIKSKTCTQKYGNIKIV